MDAETNKVFVVVRVAGLAADIATLVPSLAILDGQVVHRPPAVPAETLPEAWWAIEVTQRSQESTEPVIVEALNRLEPLHDVVLNVASDPRFQIELDCTVEIAEERPVMELSRHTLKRLADLGAAFGLEVHDYRE